MLGSSQATDATCLGTGAFGGGAFAAKNPGGGPALYGTLGGGNVDPTLGEAFVLAK